MVRCLFALSVLAVAGGSLSARNAVQTPQPANAPAFTLADVHPSPWVNFPYTHGGILRGDRYALRQATMVDLISTAYGIDPSRVDGGPSWLAFDRYDIVAQAPAGTSRAALRLMLRSLLATRFHLAAHNGDAPLPAWALIAVKPKLAESPGGNSECSPQPPPPDVISAGIPMVAFGCHNMPMDQFVQILQPLGGDYFENKPVVDSTGLTGKYDFDFHWTRRASLARAGASGISLFDAMEQQLGLKLDLRTALRPALIVDSVDRTPTPNAPDVEKALPPPPLAQFEVAVIKPSRPGETEGGMVDGNRLDSQGDSLKGLIQFAWNLNLDDDADVVGLPPWASTDRYDIQAKVPATDLDQTANGPDVEYDRAREMLRALLIDRFAIQSHTEERPAPGYSLEADGPKLRAANPAERTHCSEGPAPGEKDPRLTAPVLNRVFHCRNITMAEFGSVLPSFAYSYLAWPVADETGLTGRYDFTLSFSSLGRVQGGSGGGAVTGSTLAPADPNGAVSLSDALRKELGLKLEKVRRSKPVLVIDHINRQPAAN